jgi:hypothetical protein
MTDTLAFQIRALTRIAISPTLSRVEGNITNDSDVERSDESLAFSVLVMHQQQPSQSQLLVLALERAQYIPHVAVVTGFGTARSFKNPNRAQDHPRRFLIGASCA